MSGPCPPSRLSSPSPPLRTSSALPPALALKGGKDCPHPTRHGWRLRYVWNTSLQGCSSMAFSPVSLESSRQASLRERSRGEDSRQGWSCHHCRKRAADRLERNSPTSPR